MNVENKVPMLLMLLFGETAEAAQRGASERLRRWAEAFDEWLAELRGNFKPATHKQAVLAWRRLLQRGHKMPWELTREDFEQHAAWMEAAGYSPSTIANALGIFAKFYRWCGERGIEGNPTGFLAGYNPAGPLAGYNPAEEVRRPKVRRYREAKLLSREEMRGLLQLMQKDTSALGKRDYAFTLARLRLGPPLSSLQKLRWGQVQQEAEGAWVRWREGAERQRLPDEVWEAILEALEASGRLAGMREGDYIFAPLASPFKEETGSKAEDWLNGHYLSSSQILSCLKLYGRLAGIPEEKLTLMALRRTATRLRLEEGANVEEMKRFLNSEEGERFTKYRLSKLPHLPADEGRGGEAEIESIEAPVRKSKPFKPGEGVIHGLYARRTAVGLPNEAILAVLKENIQGMEEEVMGMRILERGLVERLGRASSNQEAAQLWEAYSLTALRLSMMLKAEREQEDKGKGDKRAEEFLAELERAGTEAGIELRAEDIHAEAQGSDEELTAASRHVVEEIATMRYGLRNLFRIAMGAEETREYLRMVELYSSTCVRLARLLKLEKGGGRMLEAKLEEEISQAIREVAEEMGLK